jgi:hypothetical protein
MPVRNPAAPDYLPFYLPGPDGSDPLLLITGLILLVGTLVIGAFYFRLHALPEQLGHHKLQFEVCAVLALISLFTHEHLFWIIALVLALVDLPDFRAPLERIARALESRSSAPKPLAAAEYRAAEDAASPTAPTESSHG